MMKILMLIVTLLLLKPLQSNSNSNVQKVEVYYGNCTLYNKEFVKPNRVKYILVSKGFAKLVINRTNKHLNFYYNNKLVFSRDQFDSYPDEQQGGEGFVSYNGVDGHTFPAEGYFQINFGASYGDLGSLYEVINYKVN